MNLLFFAVALILVLVASAWLLAGTRLLQARRKLRWVVVLIPVLLACVPLSVVLTFLLLPFWSWLEASYGIESIGHSGPAEWCYVVTFFLCLLMPAWVGIRIVRNKSHNELS